MQPIFIAKDLQELVTYRYTMPSLNEFKEISDNDKTYLKEIEESLFYIRLFILQLFQGLLLSL